MDKLILLIDHLITDKVNGIGISLSTKIDSTHGVVYDLDKIPHWKNTKLKSIIEEKFHIPTLINSDVNCFILGEKYHGLCQNCNNILAVHVDMSIGTSAIVNNRLFTDNQPLFTNATCLSKAKCKCAKSYHKSYIRTVEELLLFNALFSRDLENMNREVCENMGDMIGRLIAILLADYDPDMIVLGGRLSTAFDYCHDPVYNYLELYKQPYIKRSREIIPSILENARAIGAAYLYA